MRKILIRFDDICPTMNHVQFKRALDIMEKYNVKPLLGVIPDCKDPELQIDDYQEDFWNYIKNLENKGYKLAMHGYTHDYDSKCRGMVNHGYKSEFAGHSYTVQLKKIQNGKEILMRHGIKTNVFFAPAHSYDRNTLKALYQCGFRYMSDGFAIGPLIREGVLCIPCRSNGVPNIKKNGYYTAVFHAHEWVRENKAFEYNKLKLLCSKYQNDIVDFDTYNDRQPGNEIIYKIDEFAAVLFFRYIKPRLSYLKHKIMKYK